MQKLTKTHAMLLPYLNIRGAGWLGGPENKDWGLPNLEGRPLTKSPGLMLPNKNLNIEGSRNRPFLSRVGYFCFI